ncbi:MAG: carboxypeptidase regulatory-like domain-containing protein [Planctomycetes bacterium]|nr:carboxypeptidase regulatory-like domain-containing protein [Planctomycetota bacterium]
MKYAFGIAVLVLLLGGLAWFVFDRQNVPEVDLGNTSPSQIDAPFDNVVVADRGEPEGVQETRLAPDRSAGGAPIDARTACIVGRCVDAHGEPSAGCVLALRGVTADGQRRDAYLKDHDSIEWTHPEDVTTRADGRFAIEFVPPPPFQFMLEARADGCVQMGAFWIEIAEGARVDVGDVRLERGALVEGFVRDTNSKPIAKALISLHMPRSKFSLGKPDEMRPHSSFQAKTRDDGSYSVRGVLAFGTWTADVQEYEVVEPTIQLEPSTTRKHVDIIVRARSEVETITGTVVDDLGRPVARASIETIERSGRPGAFQTSVRDGAFTIRRTSTRDLAGPFAIAAHGDGFEDVRTEEFYEWGARDVRLVVRRGLSVDLLVRDATTGKPIEEYGIRVFPKPGTVGRQSGTDFEVRNRGEHPGGITTLGNLPRGTLWLVVEPNGRTWQRNPVHEFVVTDTGATRQTIELTPTVSRIVRVLRANGEPVAGTRVELLEPLFGAAVDDSTKVVRDENYWIHQQTVSEAILVVEAETNLTGEATVEGPGKAPLALRVLGPGHTPICENGIVLDASEAPIEIVVASGASVTGVIRPKELLEQMREIAGLSGESSANSIGHPMRPSVRLVQARDGEPVIHYPASETVFVDRDGSFTVEGIPSGDWTLELVTARAVGSNAFSHSRSVIARLSALKEGETRRLELDLSSHLHSRVTGRVLVDGEACARGSVFLQGKRFDDGFGESQKTSAQPRTDDEGRFEVLLAPGSYRAKIMWNDAELGHWISIPADSSFALQPGASQEVALRVQTGRMRLLLRDAEDQPASDARIFIKSALLEEHVSCGMSDADGVLEVRLPVGTWTLLVQHKEYSDWKKQQELRAQHGARADELLYREVRQLQVVAGPRKELTVQLPKESGY